MNVKATNEMLVKLSHSSNRHKEVREHWSRQPLYRGLDVAHQSLSPPLTSVKVLSQTFLNVKIHFKILDSYLYCDFI